MRKGLLLTATIGLGGLTLLALLMQYVLDLNPAIGAITALRSMARDTWGDRLIALTYAPAPTPGKPGHGLRVVFRPEVGPNARTREQQANEVGDWLLRQWGDGDADRPPLAFVDVRAYTDGEQAWVRVTPAARRAVAPGDGSGYPPPAPAPATTAAPGGEPR